MRPVSAVLVASFSTLTPMLIEAEPVHLSVKMRDGASLTTLVYLPDGDGPFPTLVARTIYGPPVSPIGGELFESGMTVADYKPGDDNDDDEAAIHAGWPLITENGYALVIQNTRGRNGSDGIDRSWRDDGLDGYDLIEWVNDQSWSDGRIGLFGDSAVGFSAALAAAERPPSLDALFLQAAPGDPFGMDMAPRDGALRTESLLLQGGVLAFDVSESHISERGISPADKAELVLAIGRYVQALNDGLEDPLSSEAWRAVPMAEIPELDRLMPYWSILRDAITLETYRTETSVLGRIDVPTSVVTLWQDTFAESTMALFADLEKRDVPRELLILNGTHYEIDNPRIYPEPRMLSWFDHWLKDAERPARAIVKAATQGAPDFKTSELLDGLSGVTERLYFTDNRLSLVASDSADAEFLSDPSHPVPTRGGRYLLAPSGTLDQSDLIERSDTLTFRAKPVEYSRVLSGSVRGKIMVASDAPSFDVSIRLLDMAPGGDATLILSDHLRMASASPGKPTRVAFDMGNIRHHLRGGHRLAVMIAGSDFPAWDRNPQTGLTIFESSQLDAAVITVATSDMGASYIDLPFDLDAQ